MAAPPAKRQRRMVVLSSDDEAEAQTDDEINAASKTLPGRTAQPKGSERGALMLTRNQTASKPRASLSLPSRSKSRASRASADTPHNTGTGRGQRTPSLSPEGRKKRRKISDDASTSTSLYSFFPRATEEQRWSTLKVETRPVPEQKPEAFEDIDDLIEDDYDSYDEIFSQHIACGEANIQDGSVSTPDRRKSALRPSKVVVKPSKPVSSAKRFLMPASPDPTRQDQRVKTASGSTKDDQRPWAERYAPSELDELAVHKKKVADVQSWLTEVFMGRSRRRLLVLRGPAGSGKSTTISLLSKAMGYDIVEWKNPLGFDYTAQGYTSMGAQFEEFLGRGDKFGTLDLDDAPEIPRTTRDSRRRILLIEEFPSTLGWTSPALTAFRLSLQRYLAANVQPPRATSSPKRVGIESSPPVVIIVSETLLGTTTGISDNFTVHRLLGPEICNHPGTSIIEFNRIAPTLMSKALDLILKKEARHSQRKRIPGPAVLKRFSEMGDVRSAISSLEFLCLRDDNGDWGGRVAAKMKRSERNGVALTTMERESLEMVTQREASLGIFHAVGKVVYNKREDAALAPEGSVKLPPPPEHLRHHERPKISQVSVDDLINETGTDIQTFISALHENYVPSCDGPSFTDCLEGCIESLSESDILGRTTRPSLQASRTGVGAARGAFQGDGASIDALRQDEISFQVAVRGLLFALPHPVKRRAAQPGSGGRAGDAHKMFFPTSLQLWRQVEEVEGLVDVCMRRWLNPSPSTAAAGDGSAMLSRSEGVESWSSRQITRAAFADQEEHTHQPATTVTMMSREDALLQQLPYLTMILGDQAEATELRKITRFQGAGPPRDYIPDEDVDGLDDPMESWATDRDPWIPQKQAAQGRKQQHSSSTFGPKLSPPAGELAEKLILSDDDIEDD
ncbi:hypothetical protein VTN02DRAFT_4318 [Thermoascus thermophilus]